jgi:hypothetical protein
MPSAWRWSGREPASSHHSCLWRRPFWSGGLSCLFVRFRCTQPTTHTHTHTLSLSLSLRHTHTQPRSHTHSLSLSLTLSLSLSLSLSQTHTHTSTHTHHSHGDRPAAASHCVVGYNLCLACALHCNRTVNPNPMQAQLGEWHTDPIEYSTLDLLYHVSTLGGATPGMILTINQVMACPSHCYSIHTKCY